MSKRILVESSFTERIQVKDCEIKRTVLPTKGINYLDDDTNAYSYEEEDEKANMYFEYNNEELYSFLEEIHKEHCLMPEVIFTHKTVDKQILFTSGEEKHQRIYYNEISLALHAKKGMEDKQCFNGFGFTNQPITKKQMYDLYNLLALQIGDVDSCIDISDATYEIILGPEVAGVFIHEIIGHMCEYDNGSSIMQSISNSITEDFTVIDDPTSPNLWGSYEFDDEGIQGQKTVLFEKGIFKNFLHSEASAHAMNTTPNGHARSLNYQFRPIIRMSNTYLETGHISFDEMVATIPYGIVALTSSGGMLKRDVFKLNVLSGIMIERGKLTQKTGSFSIWGKVDDVLKKICGIGDTALTCSGQGCYKLKQGPLPVSFSAPHIHIKSVLITKK